MSQRTEIFVARATVSLGLSGQSAVQAFGYLMMQAKWSQSDLLGVYDPKDPNWARSNLWEPAVFKEVHPVLGTRNILHAIEFYVEVLGFKLTFKDNAASPNYVGFRRDAVELHMQFQFEHEMRTTRLRFLTEDPDALFNEYRRSGVKCATDGIRDTVWGTREFALYDLDRNSLTFYCPRN